MANHIHWYGFNRQGFKQYMVHCGGVIGNADFELASEAITLGEKLLVNHCWGSLNNRLTLLRYNYWPQQKECKL